VTSAVGTTSRANAAGWRHAVALRRRRLARNSRAIAAAAASVLLAGAVAACSAASAAPRARTAAAVPVGSGRSASEMRPLPRPLYGVTVDDVANIRGIVASLRHLPRMPTTRIYFDVKEPASYYAAAVRELRPVTYLMGELLDSSDEIYISTAAYRARVKSYLSAFGSEIDLWEIGNEVNGNWTGRYPVVSAKLTEAYRQVTARHKRTALTLYYNAGCGDGAGELSPLAFSRRYVPAAVRDGLDYVFLSYYEDDCNGIRPSGATWTAYFRDLHALYPHALLGFGEIGMNNPVTNRTTAAAKSLISHYYGLPIKLRYYVGGFFWWYYYEDCVPYQRKPFWRALRAGIDAEAARLAADLGR
jgi:hypothetical protein